MGMASLQLVVAGMLWVMCWSGQNANGQSIQLTPMDGGTTTMYSNNSIVNRTDIGTGAAALLCTTTHSPCCSSANPDTHWYFPNGGQVPNSQAGVLPYYRRRSTSPQAVRLNRNSDGTTTGIFRCDIPDASGGTQSMFVGIYDSGTGMPTATTLVYSETTRSLTCTSTGGPATTVTWRKDGANITVNTTYQQTQMVTDTATGGYETVLTIAQSVSDVFGTYSCTVGNSRGTSDPIDATVSSLQVVITPGANPTAGQSFTFTCAVTPLGGLMEAPTVQWSGPAGSIATGGDFTVSSTSSYTLTINPLQQSRDGQYTCQATVGSTTGSSSATLTVGAPSVSVLITPTPAGTAVAGQSYSLSCSVSGADSLNPTSITYRWYNESSNPRSEVGTTEIYTLNLVQPYHAGQYTCDVMITSPYLNEVLSQSMMQGITVQIPDPTEVNVLPPGPISHFAGSELTLSCGIVLGFTLRNIIGGLHVTSVWTDPGGGMLSSDGRITVSPASLEGMSSTFISEVMFDTLRISDAGTYTCQATVAPLGSTAGTVMNGSRSASGPTLSIANPAIQLGLSSNATRLPNTAPYNTFFLSCTATIPEGVTVSKTFTWTKRIESSTSLFDILTDNGDSVLITSTNLTQPTSTSVLTVRETTAGDYRYRCRADLSELSIMNTMDVYPINVTGSANPVPPQNLMNTTTLHDRATVGWSVSYIAYTPESYSVNYGTAMDSLDMSTTATQRGDNFTIPSQPFMFSAELTGLSPGVTYYYQVEARNSEGPTLSAVQQFTSAEQPPTPPQMFQITAVTTNSLSFSWQKPETANGEITRYEISCRPLLLGIPMPQDHNTGNTARMTVLADLHPGVRYNCSIGARNGAGLSNLVYADDTTPEIAPSGPPLNFMAVTPRARNITFSWAPPNAAERNGVITGYSLSCVPQTSGGSRMYPEAGTFTVEGFMPATSYNCSIFASNRQGNGPPTSVNPRTLEDSPDVAPQGVMFEYDQDSPEMVLFSWQPLPPVQQNGMITGYNIACASSSGELVNGMSGGALNATLGMFTPATQYSCNITASTSAGTGPVNTVSLLTLPVAPENVTLTVNPTGSASRLLVSWTIDPGVISHYTIYVTRLERGNTVLPPYTSTVTQFGIPRGDLDPGEGVSVNVSASNSAGEGARSPGVRERTREERPGSVGCQSRWTDLTTIPAIQVNWTAPQEPNGIILRYYLILTSYDGNTVIDTTNVNTSVTLVTTFDATLDDGVPYTVQIFAENSAGNGTVCNVTDFTNELQSPVPSDVSVTRLNGTVVRVMWQRLSLVEARGHIRYRVMVTSTSANKRKRQTTQGERMCTLMSSPCEVPANESSVLVGGLDPDTSYRVTVSTVNSEDEDGPTSDAVIAPALPTPSSNTLPTIIGAAVAAVLIVLIIVIIIIISLVVWWKRSQTKRVRLPSPPPSFDMKVSSIEEGATLDQSASKGFMHSESDLATAEPLETVPTTGSMEDQVIDRLRPIAVASFASHVLDMHHDRDKGFELEYQSVGNEHLAAYEVAKLSYNKTKNRFANIFPYDFSRVKLQEIKGVDGSEYVNASYIDGYNHPNAYIAAQGPMPNTCSDFWRMIWEQKLVTVVMLTKCTEAGKRKCEQYWPDNVNETFDAGSNLLVTLTELIPFADYEIKRFSIQDTSKPDTPALSVTHYHFLGWPDHGVPKFATSLIAFIRRVRKNHNKDGPPMLVHCSAGVGRTGTFILLDSMLERMKVEKTVNVYEFLRNMRAKRVFMVQTLAQYVFIHDALEELITCGETDISATNLRVKVNKLHKIIPEKAISGFEDQFRLLDKVSRKPNDSDCSDALQHYNRSKNRYPDRVPYNLSRARLRPTGVTGAEYVNASFVDGYKQRNAYLATQAPLKETVNDFWRMVWEFKSKAIMMLCNTEENGQEASFPFWPTRLQEPETYGKLLLTLQVEEPCKEYTVRKFEIKEEKPQNPNQNQHPSFVVTLFHYKEWPEHDRPRSTSSILQLVEQVNKVQRSTGNRVITIMCNDGMGRTGTFLCIHAQLERVKSEGLVDFFQFVKSSRIHRPSIVSELEHYIFCHDTLADFLDSFDTYANFKDLGDGQR